MGKTWYYGLLVIYELSYHQTSVCSFSFVGKTCILTGRPCFLICFRTVIHFSTIYIHMLIVQLYIEGLCHGNLLEEEAINISNIFKSNFPVEPLPLQMRQGENVLCLPSGANLVMDVSVKNKSETNSVIEVDYFPSGIRVDITYLSM